MVLSLRISFRFLRYPFLTVCFILLYLQIFGSTANWHRYSRNVKAANETLGFSAIYVISSDATRRDYIQQAAAITGLHLTIPELKEWSDDDVLQFRLLGDKRSKIGIGSIKAWLNHNYLLQTFVDSGLSTALFLEDDVTSLPPRRATLRNEPHF